MVQLQPMNEVYHSSQKQMDLFKFVPSLTKINFVESYENKQAKKEEKPAKPAEKKSKK